MDQQFVPMVAVEDLPDDLRAQWEATERPGLRDFIRVMANAPEHFRRYNEVYGQLRFDNHLDPRLTELVRIAVAQTTRCQVCMAGRHPGAIEAGLTEELVDEIGESERRAMTEAEFAAVTYATKLATDHLSVTDDDKAELRRHFDPEQVVELSLLTVMCMVGRFSAVLGLEETWCPT
ncbi:MAG: carboxymuconolactone decarboxylase family protein [Acidimicrobiia bacterium]